MTTVEDEEAQEGSSGRRRDEVCVECQKFFPETIEEEENIGKPDSNCTLIFYPSYPEDIQAPWGQRTREEATEWFLHHRRWDSNANYIGEVWQFDPPRPEFKDNLLCDPCFEKCREQGKIRKIEGRCAGCFSFDHNGIGCGLCETRYRCMGMSRTQAADCASHLFKRMKNDGTATWWILASYGSDFDTMLFRFKLPLAEGVKEADPICDSCIRRFLDEKQIEESPGDFPWGIEWTDYGEPVPR